MRQLALDQRMRLHGDAEMRELPDSRSSLPSKEGCKFSAR